MTDEARIERLTELARRVWPDASVPVDVMRSDTSARVLIDDPRAMGAITLTVIMHPRALDALEAALLVLAGDMSAADWKSVVGALGDRVPAWVEQLASEWTAKASQWMAEYRAAGEDEHSGPMEACRQQLVLAHQLLERAKGSVP